MQPLARGNDSQLPPANIIVSKIGLTAVCINVHNASFGLEEEPWHIRHVRH